MKRISKGLTRAGFNVVREKIETVPWHPAAPSNEHADPVMPKDCYFETHIAVVIKDNDNRDQLQTLINEDFPDAHLSRNAFKSTDDGYVQMITYRTYSGTYETFKRRAQGIREALKECGFKIEDVVTEFSIYDTKVTHDAEWISRIA